MQAGVDLQEFARGLFQMWDKRQYGKLKILELSRNLIALGIVPNEMIAASCLKFLLHDVHGHLPHTEALQHEMTAMEFLQIFRPSDYFSKKILRALNEQIRQSKDRKDEEASNVKSKAMVVVRKQTVEVESLDVDSIIDQPVPFSRKPSAQCFNNLHQNQSSQNHQLFPSRRQSTLGSVQLGEKVAPKLIGGAYQKNGQKNRNGHYYDKQIVLQENLDTFLQSRIAAYIFNDIYVHYDKYKIVTSRLADAPGDQESKQMIKQRNNLINELQKVYGPQTQLLAGVMS